MACSKSSSTVVGVLLIFVILAFAGPVYGHGNQKDSPEAWMENYTLILTDAQNLNEAYAASDAVEMAGGHVAVIFPNQVMLGWVPADAAEGLVGKNKIRKISHQPVKESGRDEAGANAIAFFNEVASGAWKAKKAKVRAKQEADPFPAEMLPDSFEAPPVSYEHFMANLEANGIDAARLKAAGITLTEPAPGAVAPSPGNSDYMMGRVLFTAIYVESNGLKDPNTYTWTGADRVTIQNEIVAGLSWWVSKAKYTYDTPLSFLYRHIYVTSSYEPILHSSGSDFLWIEEIMAKLGFAAGDKWARTTAYNAAKRVTYNCNWAVVSFIGYNPSPAPSTFTDGYFAYWWGTYSQLLFRNDGWAISQYDIVNAHETGHAFGAPDEYYVAGYGGCTDCGPAKNGVINGNCEFCNANAISCMMRGNNLSLCGYTPGHLGWQGPTNVRATTYGHNSGIFRDMVVPAQIIQYRCSFRVWGPSSPTLPTADLRVRFRAEYLFGTVDAPFLASDDTGWGIVPDSINFPTTTGWYGWTVYWNRVVPAPAADCTSGPANLVAQISVEKYGKGQHADWTRFSFAPGANPLTAPPAGSDDSGPVVVKMSDEEAAAVFGD